MLASQSAASLRKDASVTQVRAVQVLSWEEGGQDGVMGPGLQPDLSRLAFNLSFSALDFCLFTSSNNKTLKAEMSLHALLFEFHCRTSFPRSTFTPAGAVLKKQKQKQKDL